MVRSMVPFYWKYIKDLRYLNRDLNELIVVDKNRTTVRKNKEKTLIVPEFKEKDEQLLRIIPLLSYMARPDVKDARQVLKKLGKNPIDKFEQLLEKGNRNDMIIERF